jgi:hypothetical protein
MPWRQPFINSKNENSELEHFRQGTREQYDSGWVAINPSSNWEFVHNLDEIPPVVQVQYSYGSDGANPRRAIDGTEMTLVYGNADGDIETQTTTITVTNDLSEVLYFRLFAM